MNKLIDSNNFFWKSSKKYYKVSELQTIILEKNEYYYFEKYLQK